MLKLVQAYVWKGVTHFGEHVQGIQLEDRKDRVRAQLERKGILVTQLHATQRLTWTTRRITSREIVDFSNQLGHLLKAGFTLASALECLAEQYAMHSMMPRLFNDLRASLENGITFSEALGQHQSCFSGLYCHVVMLGEQCGNLADQLIQLSLYEEKLLDIQQRIQKALYYPMILIGTSIAVVLLLLFLVVPQFEALFHSVNIKLPLLTRSLISIVGYLKTGQQFMMISLLGSVSILMLFYSKIGSYSTRFSGFVLHLPWVGSIIKKAVFARFAYTWGTSLKAGLPMLDALGTTIHIAHYPKYQCAVNDIQKWIIEGLSLSQALTQTCYFPPLLIQTVATGQLSGQLEKSLLQWAKFMDTQVHTSIDRMISFLEPVLLLGIGIVMGVIMLALYWPMFELGNVVGLV